MDTQQLIQWLEGRLDRLDNKLDSLGDSASRVDVTLKQHETHIQELRAAIAPIQAHVQQARGVAWVVGAVLGVGGVLATWKGLIL